MAEQFDAQGFLMRANEVAKEIRKSEAYPAILGGIAGGIAGALMAAIIAGRRSSSSPPASVNAKSESNWALRDVAQLIAVIAPIAKQVQAWYKEQKR